mmetsp:Transcript_8559/g.15538  ORF Transcript_8559/g.15538 Transcript_8559/m.15538 type:complete len:227 (+) Transcript_8559:495-1175(+)
MACSLSFSSLRTSSFDKKSKRAEVVSPAIVSIAASWTLDFLSGCVSTPGSPCSIPSLALSSLMSSILLSFPSNMVFCTALPRSSLCSKMRAMCSFSASSSTSGTRGVAGRSTFLVLVLQPGEALVAEGAVDAPTVAFCTSSSPMSDLMMVSMSCRSAVNARFFRSAAVFVCCFWGFLMAVLVSLLGIVASILAMFSRLSMGAVLLRTSNLPPADESRALPSLLMGA